MLFNAMVYTDMVLRVKLPNGVCIKDRQTWQPLMEAQGIDFSKRLICCRDSEGKYWFIQEKEKWTLRKA